MTVRRTVTTAFRDGIRLVRDLFGYGARTGRWWIVAIIPLLAGAALVVAAAKATVPTLVYALF